MTQMPIRNIADRIRQGRYGLGGASTFSLVLALAIAPSGAYAGEQASTKQSEADIVVTGERSAVQLSIDRKSFSTSNDLQAATGTVVDVLRNLPSVEVDGQGNVSLRGDQNVEILIDGKPSTMMSSANRAEALQQLSASGIASVEVINNPSARFKPDGASGIINIIMKKNRKRGESGSVQISGGSDERYNLSATEAYNHGPFSLSLNAALRQDVARRPYDNRRMRLDPATDAATTSVQRTFMKSYRRSKIFGIGLDYDLSKADRLSSAFSYNRRFGRLRIDEYDRIDNLAALAATEYTRLGSGFERETSTDKSIKWVHQFGDKGHAFSLDLRHGLSIEDQYRRYLRHWMMPADPDSVSWQQPYTRQAESHVTAEYEHPLSAKAKLLLGYDRQEKRDLYDRATGDIDPATGFVLPDGGTNDSFRYKELIHAFYTTYERPIGVLWSMVAGLRLENSTVETCQQTTAETSHRSHWRVYPTMHVENTLSPVTTIRLSYSHRVTRPQPRDLNPFGNFQDLYNLKTGNPRLLPQETDSVEVGVETKAYGMNWNVTLYARKSRNNVTEVGRYITPDVFLTTKENLGRSLQSGLDFSVNGKISPMLSINSSGSVFYNRIHADNLGLADARDLVGYNLKTSMDFRLSAKDLVQVNASYTGKSLTAQGFRLSSGSVNLGYRRQLAKNVSAVLTLSDVFDGLKERNVIDTPVLHDAISRRRSIRTLSLSLVWLHGGGTKNAADSRFNYGGDKD